MAADSWPLTLPQRLERNGNSGRMGDGLVETQPDIGPPISRARTTAVVDNLAGTIKVSEALLGTLKAFYRTTLIQGSLPFYFPDQSAANNPALMKFAKGAAPSWNEIGPDLYQVQITLLVLP